MERIQNTTVISRKNIYKRIGLFSVTKSARHFDYFLQCTLDNIVAWTERRSDAITTTEPDGWKWDRCMDMALRSNPAFGTLRSFFAVWMVARKIRDQPTPLYTVDELVVTVSGHVSDILENAGIARMFLVANDLSDRILAYHVFSLNLKQRNRLETNEMTVVAKILVHRDESTD
ncbi:hypothetical protein AVEN_68706-1 [Araneus ventricosus]|uniref:Uncharacterized protein n=1 Tax=Araneus ventricosus TaxID=182803 RepID=A0A4Y2KYR8_ARAVE|nr:hypothetical protein AVEN_68706-1 [Araneus ventricosus]